jgi:hypothetical protein
MILQGPLERASTGAAVGDGPAVTGRALGARDEEFLVAVFALFQAVWIEVLAAGAEDAFSRDRYPGRFTEL